MAAPLLHSIAIMGKWCATYSAMLVGADNRDGSRLLGVGQSSKAAESETLVTFEVGVGKRRCAGRMDTRTRSGIHASLGGEG